ncbi:MAG TPA: molybdenum cofactor biosynthesis protein MoaE, partial [Tianweitania sediminis]|nr:molybdenum cofactor biosynthesis protein MoaE [Tianweitania sediminis]
MSPALSVRVQREDFDTAAEIKLAGETSRQTGAVVSFTGICRDDDGGLAALELEHYPGMAERALAATTQEALDRWPLLAITIIHR